MNEILRKRTDVKNIIGVTRDRKKQLWPGIWQGSITRDEPTINSCSWCSPGNRYPSSKMNRSSRANCEQGSTE